MKKKPLIVLMTDFSEASFQAFEPTVELAKRLSGRVALLHVVRELVTIPHGPPGHPRGLAHSMQEAQAKMDEAKVRLGGEVPVSTEVLPGDHVHDVVKRYAGEQHADFISLATHGRTGLRRALMGSVAEAVLRRSKVPVVVFPLNHEPSEESDEGD